MQILAADDNADSTYYEPIWNFLIVLPKRLEYRRREKEREREGTMEPSGDNQTQQAQTVFPPVRFYKGINRIYVDCRGEIVAMHPYECSNSFLLLEFK